MSYINISSYNAIHLVHQYHQVPHLNSMLHLHSSSFDITYGRLWNPYTKSLLTLPIILSCVMFVMVLSIFIITFLRPWILCVKIIPRSLHGDNDKKLGLKSSIQANRNQSFVSNNTMLTMDRYRQKWSPSIRLLMLAMVIFTILGIISNNSIFFGNTYVEDGVNEMVDNLDSIQSIATELSSDGSSLATESNILSTIISASIPTCPSASALLSYSTALNSNINEYNTIISPIPMDISSASNRVYNIGHNYKNYIIWIIYALFYVMFLLFIIGVFRQNKNMLQSSIITNGITMMLLFLFGSLIMIFLMGFSDYCISPFHNLIPLISPGSTQEMMSYYTTCQGTNPISISISLAESDTIHMETYITNLLQTNCTNNQYLLEAEGTLILIQNYLNDIDTKSSCPPIEHDFYDVIAYGLCNKSFIGLYILWLWIYLTTLCIFFSLIVLSIIHVYFGRFWSIDENSEEDNDIDLFVDGEEGGQEHYNNYQDPDDIVVSVHNPTIRGRSRSLSNMSDYSIGRRPSSRNFGLGTRNIPYDATEVISPES